MKRKNINTASLEDNIRKHFESHPGVLYTVRDVLDALFLTHKAYPQVKDTIFQLADRGFLKKERKKYTLNTTQSSEKKEQKPSPNLIEGTFDATPLARNFSYAFVRTEQGDFFVSSEDTLNAFHGDTVAIEPFFRNGKSDYCYVRKVVKRASETLAGDIQQSRDRYYFICSNPKIHQWFDVSDLGNAVPNQKVMLQVTNWGNRTMSKPPVGKVIEVLGESGNPETELLAVIRQNNLPLEFPDYLSDEIEVLPEEIDPEEIRGRKDYRNLITFTIDPSSAKDYDDAISLENTDSGWRLFVHIADVAHYIKLDSKLFGECLNRGNSYYFPRKVIPMLPEKLSNRVCSLRQNEDKLTMTVVTEFDKKGNVKRQSLYESVINSNSRLAYEQVDDLFDGKTVEIPEEVIKAIFSARELSRLLTASRLKAGYLFFDLPETEYLYDEEGFVHQMKQSVETESHKLIENFMLVANQYVAEILTQQAPVTMYRVHELPDMEKLERLSILLGYYGLSISFKESMNRSLQELLLSFPDESFHKVFDRLILRSLKKAKYTVEHLPHFGLAIETYTHFTSPIRRLCDLVVHHLCKTYIIHSAQNKFTKKQVIQYSTIASEKELVADEAERDIERVMNRIYMKEHIGDIYEGIIVGTNSSSIFIQLEKIPISGILKISQLPKGKWNYNDEGKRFLNERTGDYYQLMDTVQVQVIQVSDDVYFELVDDRNTHHHHTSGLTPKPTSQKRKSDYRKQGKKSYGRKRR
ncbi:MAG: VacB/RNase II family 3'-5' exoribonuclease [Candidatus Cloacimonadaceae bacterium]